MPTKRVFRSSGATHKSEDYHGGAQFSRLIPDLSKKGVKSLNLEVPFEEALSLQVALSSCVQSLNRFNRGTAKGKSMGLLVSIKLDNNSIVIIEKDLGRKRKLRAA